MLLDYGIPLYAMIVGDFKLFCSRASPSNLPLVLLHLGEFVSDSVKTGDVDMCLEFLNTLVDNINSEADLVSLILSLAQWGTSNIQQILCEQFSSRLSTIRPSQSNW